MVQDFEDYEEPPLLHLACKKGQCDIAKYLIEKCGASVLIMPLPGTDGNVPNGGHRNVLAKFMGKADIYRRKHGRESPNHAAEVEEAREFRAYVERVAQVEGREE